MRLHSGYAGLQVMTLRPHLLLSRGSENLRRLWQFSGRLNRLQLHELNAHVLRQLACPANIHGQTYCASFILVEYNNQLTIDEEIGKY